jgi:hypothetical protein
VTTQRLQRWVESGALRRHRTSRREIADLLAMVDRDLKDARATAVSLDRRFAIAYSAVLGLASMVLAASGYRVVARRGHHAVTLQALPEIMGDDVCDLATYFDSCRVLRNASDYDRAGVVASSDVEELLREAIAFRAQVLEWLTEAHERLL